MSGNDDLLMDCREAVQQIKEAHSDIDVIDAAVLLAVKFTKLDALLSSGNPLPFEWDRGV